MNKNLITICTLLFAAGLQSAHAQHISKKKVEKIFKSSGIYDQHYTGFELYDPEKKKVIYEYNSNKHAIPASNTKLFTFYTALNMLGDSIPGIKYITRGDSLIFWGTGDPVMLHSEIKSTRVYDFLKAAPYKLFYSTGSYASSFYRPGQASYNPELTSMPVEENNITVYASADGKLRTIPALFTDSLVLDREFHPRSFMVRRSEDGNTFVYPDMPVPKDYKRTVSLRTSPDLTVTLLKDTLKKEVKLIKMGMPLNTKTIYSIPSDTLYKRMLQPSDNYIAEQLLILCSSTQPGPLNQDSVIAYSRRKILTNLPDDFQWNDGSGLSRYNLFTPRTIIQLLLDIQAKVPDQKRLLDMFPAGGVSGTIKNAYKTDNGQPFVWAKTGTLSNVHIQGGYLITRKGKKLLYSFMNNNYMVPTSDIRNEMGRVMTEIHNRF